MRTTATASTGSAGGRTPTRTPSATAAARATAFVVAAVVGAVAVVACSGDDVTRRAAAASELLGEFGATTVSTAVDLLAESGVEVRVRPGDDALAAVDGTSPVRLLRFQVRNMALEVNQRSGIIGADLDALAEDSGGLPISYVIAGWASTAQTPAARTAAQLLGDLDRVPPHRLVVPGLVSALFLADAAGRGGSGGDEASTRPAVAFRSTAGASGDFCADVAEYVSGALAGVLAPERTLDPDWLAAAIDRYADFEPDADRFRASIGALALTVYATSISKPWVPLLVASPGDVHYIIGDDELTPAVSTLRLSVERGEAYIAEEAQECAALAGLELPENEIEGSAVRWYVEGLAPHITAATQAGDLVPNMSTVQDGPAGDLELDESGYASFEYQTRGETSEAHRRGTLQTFTVPVGAAVGRAEIADVRAAIESLLGGGELGVAGAEVAARYAAVSERLGRLLLPAASTRVTIQRHVERPPEDEEGLPGDECGDGCAVSTGDPHLVPLRGAGYDFQAAGEYTLLRSPDGSVDIQARQQPLGTSRSVAITTALAMRAGDRRLTIATGDDGGRIDVRIDGEPVTPTERMDLGGGAHLVPHERGVEVGFPDGTVLWATLLRGIEVQIRPSDELRRSGVGLLAAASSDGARLPPLPDGSVLGSVDTADERYDQIYGELGPAWRVDARTSLFDYAPGETTESFLEEGFPDRPLDYDDLTPEQLAFGGAACEHIEFVPLRQSCVFDVALSGDTSYGEVYAVIWGILDDGALALGEEGPITAVPSPSPSTPQPTPQPDPDPNHVAPTTTAPIGEVAEPRAGAATLRLSGDLVASYSDRAFDGGVVTELVGVFRAVDGSVVVLRADGCPEEGILFVALRSLDGDATSSAQLCSELVGPAVAPDEQPTGEGYIWVAGDGTYEVRVDTDSLATHTLTMEVFTDPTPAIVDPSTFLEGGDERTLDGIGDTVVYAFDGSADGPVSFTSAGFDRACAIEAYGAPEPGSGQLWNLGTTCPHDETAGTGLAAAGVSVPLIVFARTAAPVPVGLTPGEPGE